MGWFADRLLSLARVEWLAGTFFFSSFCLIWHIAVNQIIRTPSLGYPLSPSLTMCLSISVCPPVSCLSLTSLSLSLPPPSLCVPHELLAPLRACAPPRLRSCAVTYQVVSCYLIMVVYHLHFLDRSKVFRYIGFAQQAYRELAQSKTVSAGWHLLDIVWGTLFCVAVSVCFFTWSNCVLSLTETLSIYFEVCVRTQRCLSHHPVSAPMISPTTINNTTYLVLRRHRFLVRSYQYETEKSRRRKPTEGVCCVFRRDKCSYRCDLYGANICSCRYF